MTVVLSELARNTSVNAVSALLDGGIVEFQDEAGTEVATVTFDDPAFPAASGGEAQANEIARDLSTTGGTITQFQAKTSGGDVVFSGDVSTIDDGTGDITLTSVVIAADEELKLSLFFVRQPSGA